MSCPLDLHREELMWWLVIVGGLALGSDVDDAARSAAAPVLVLKEVDPPFPEAARGQGLDDVSCRVRFVLGSGEEPVGVEIFECPEVFRASLEEAAWQWRFVPSLAEGGARAPHHDVEVVYPREGLAGPPRVAPVSGPVEVDWSDVEAKKRVAPKMPDEVKGQGKLNVRCQIRFFIDERGVPYEVVLEECPEPFRDSALEAAWGWRFAPTIRDGEPVEAQFVLGITYRIK